MLPARPRFGAGDAVRLPISRRFWTTRGRFAAARSARDADLLRAELLSIEQLKRYAAALAGQQRIDPRPGPDRLLRRLADNERVLLDAYDVVTAAAQPEQRIVPAEAWLLDNFYLIEQQIDLARRHLPRGYSRQLPRLADGTLAGLPRIYGLALELISHQDGRVEADNVNQFVAAYQSVVSLKLGELWAFPIMLRLALLENLRRVSSRIARRREESDAARVWADRMLGAAEQEPRQLIQLLARFADANAEVPLTAPFVDEFYRRLQGHGPAMAFAQTWVEHQLLEEGVDAKQLLQIESRTAAANQIAIANSIGSLRFISAMDWTLFVETPQCRRTVVARRAGRCARCAGLRHTGPLPARRGGGSPSQRVRRGGRRGRGARSVPGPPQPVRGRTIARRTWAITWSTAVATTSRARQAVDVP